MTNLERVQKGKRPISPNGSPIQLRHVLQGESGSVVVEIQEITHQDYFSQLHRLIEDGTSFRKISSIIILENNTGNGVLANLLEDNNE